MVLTRSRLWARLTAGEPPRCPTADPSASASAASTAALCVELTAERRRPPRSRGDVHPYIMKYEGQ